MSTVEYNFENRPIEVPSPLRRSSPLDLNTKSGSSAAGSRRSSAPLAQSSASESQRSQQEQSSSRTVSPAQQSEDRGGTHGSKPHKKLHRIAEVRVQQGASIRSVARKLNLSATEIRAQENPHCDLLLSDLLKWQSVLEVPLSELLVECDGPLSEPIGRRASMLRVMKTAKAIEESAEGHSMKRLANMLVKQLVQIMPELADVSAWHTIGQRRTQNELGKIVERSIPDNFFNEPQK